ncbi:MAG: glucosamine-6-phosphate deaminase [Clostridiales bacterium]|nr:glucosamine-6-phosphate deaminase [Clostridiales bacterium]
MKFVQAKNYSDMSRKAANIISAQVILKNDSVIGLATGSTPIGVYTQLIDWHKKGDLSFAKAISVNLDEYCGLPVSHPESYRSFMDNNFFDHIDIERNNTYLPDGMAIDFSKECKDYDQLIDDLGGIDLQLLGVGNNGHIGFNEPSEEFYIDTHSVELTQSTIASNARFFEDDISKVPKTALTLGIRYIMQAKKIVLIANGEVKMNVIERAFSGKITPMLPISILQLHSNVTIVYSKV